MEREDFYEACKKAIAIVKPKLPQLTEEDYSVNFQTLGLDSLDMMMFLLELDSFLSEPTEDIDVSDANTIEALYNSYIDQTK